MPVEDLQTLITECIVNCLKHNPKSSTSVGNDIPISTKELCNFLNITEPTLIRWRKKGKIPFLQIGSRILYQKSAVLSALEHNKKVSYPPHY